MTADLRMVRLQLEAIGVPAHAGGIMVTLDELIEQEQTWLRWLYPAALVWLLYLGVYLVVATVMGW